MLARGNTSATLIAQAASTLNEVQHVGKMLVSDGAIRLLDWSCIRIGKRLRHKAGQCGSEVHLGYCQGMDMLLVATMKNH